MTCLSQILNAFLKLFRVGALVCLSILVANDVAKAEPPVLRNQPASPARVGTLRVESPVNQAGSVILHWTGTIAAPMHDRLQAAFEAFASTRFRVVLVMNSGGGVVSEGEKVIGLLQRIRRTHQLDTVVMRGGMCGSMCLPVYLQGQKRFGARTSSWLFHEITKRGSQPFAKKKVDGRYSQLIDLYWVPAGVSRTWIDRMLPLADGHDYWQTGQELITERSGIITDPIENRSQRILETDDAIPSAGTRPPPYRSAQPQQLLPARPPTPALDAIRDDPSPVPDATLTPGASRPPG